jgi:hypothetical protein
MSIRQVSKRFTRLDAPTRHVNRETAKTLENAKRGEINRIGAV